MNRLTKGSEKHNNEYISYVADSSLYPEMMGYEQTQADIDAINKLGRLEDIEEELGIGLPILFKALKNGIQGYKSIESLFYEETNKTWYIECIYKYGDYGTHYTDVLALKDYGKTWWLKEDLESE